MRILIIKLGATGDVVRTTPLLRRFSGSVNWITAEKNLPLVQGIESEVRVVPWGGRRTLADCRYDLVINLEDDRETSGFLNELKFDQLFGAHLDGNGQLIYTEDSRAWFDLSLISRFGRKEADRLKLLNRRTYQDLIFDGLGFRFTGERYFLPAPIETGLSGDVAIAAEAGPVWPMKKWAYYDELKQRLESRGLTVNLLPARSSFLEHLYDVQNHQCLVGGDSLPMHFALGTATACVTLFTCTSPWEIHDYGVQKKIISPLLEEFFYTRGYDHRATTAISVEETLKHVIESLPG